MNVLMTGRTKVIVTVDKIYEQSYNEGWDARMADLYVNPYVYDFDTARYTAWHHGWEDCDVELEADK